MKCCGGSITQSAARWPLLDPSLPLLPLLLSSLLLSLLVLGCGVTAKKCVLDEPEKGGLQLTFSGMEGAVSYNQFLELDAVQEAPAVRVVIPAFVSLSQVLVVMVDPDAPQPTTCSGHYFLHWWQQGSLTQDGTFVSNTEEESLNYTAPHPPVCDGSHRYQVLVYTADAVTVPEAPNKRSDFSLKDQMYGLGPLLASTQFRVRCP